MRVNTLELRGFRNYTQSTCVFSPGINIIYGANAQGKTNLLEAVYILSCGRSFRARTDRELIGFGLQTAAISAKVESGGREQKIEIYLKVGVRKTILQNGVRKTRGELSDSMTVVLFCAEDLGLVRYGAAVRRKLMDVAISQLRPGYAAVLAEYNRIYEHKKRILKDWREKPSLLDTLGDFSEQMCLAGAKIVRYRAAFAARLCEEARIIHREFTNNKEDIDIAYRTVSTVTDPLSGQAAIAGEIWEHQKAHHQAEVDSAQCLTGVHKDDLEISINDIPARVYASQGQVRTAALSIKLAEREIHLRDAGEYPVLLLDDVLSELDNERQEFILNRIGGGQTLITCCEDERIAERTGGNRILIEEGRILNCTSI